MVLMDRVCGRFGRVKGIDPLQLCNLVLFLHLMRVSILINVFMSCYSFKKMQHVSMRLLGDWYVMSDFVFSHCNGLMLGS